jgi:hypothetical protein
VLDERGAVIPKAEVILKQAAQQTSKILADAFGAFAFSVQPGEYSLDVSSRGFKTLTIRNITIHGGESKVLPPISLQVASIGSCADDFQLPTFAVERLASKEAKSRAKLSIPRASWSRASLLRSRYQLAVVPTFAPQRMNRASLR